MTVIVILLLASLSVAAAFLAAFIWAVRSGQYEDTVTPSLRILMDDESGQSTTIADKETEERGIDPV